MPPPTDVAGVQRFLCMVKYLAKFLPRLSKDSEPLRQLTHKGVDWVWGREQQAFEIIKKKVAVSPRTFQELCQAQSRITRKLKRNCWRKLTDWKRFTTTYGHKIVLWTDHKPLVNISKKPLSQVPKHLQYLLIRLRQYDTEIKYKPGADNSVS